MFSQQHCTWQVCLKCIVNGCLAVKRFLLLFRTLARYIWIANEFSTWSHGCCNFLVRQSDTETIKQKAKHHHAPSNIFSLANRATGWTFTFGRTSLCNEFFSSSLCLHWTWTKKREANLAWRERIENRKIQKGSADNSTRRSPSEIWFRVFRERLAREARI